ncbi:EAL domain-containing protein [Massilia sp. W12]|uniref:EAL and HDOD domain-containing protein n=1 Tax=Massilia sp. W12 TaxID=3126507 RepID=UPI0030CD7E30
MNEQAIQDQVQGITPLKNFFLGRQPIFDRGQNLFAYELLFRRSQSAQADISDDLSATATVISHAAELGMEKVVGDALGLINADAAVLQSEFIRILPRQKIILEILESVQADAALLQQLALLGRAGFRFALDDVVSITPCVQQMLPHATLVKLDVSQIPPEQLAPLVNQLHAAGKLLVAEKVEQLEQYERCHALGFDYFQGYYFARPALLSGRKLAPSARAVLEILNLLNANAENAEIEQAIKQHVSLGLHLLRLANTAAFGCQMRISSLSQALMLMGRRQLQRWLQVLLYAQCGRDGCGNQPLLRLASTRGKLMELMVRKIWPHERVLADTAFTVGIMSLMDVLFGVAMDEILTQMRVVDEVASALLSRQGVLGEMLTLTESIEHIEDAVQQVSTVLSHLHLSEEDFYLLELDAFDWADRLSAQA